MKYIVTGMLIILAGILFVKVDAFCKRHYEDANWERQTLAHRSQEADIIVYAEVLDSPCKKPVPPTTPRPTTVPTAATEPTVPRVTIVNATSGNSTLNETLPGNKTTAAPTTVPPTTVPPTTVPPTTLPPTTAGPVHNCSYELYNATLKIHCVIKGGSIPEFIHLDGIGLDEKEMCVHKHANERASVYHLYDDGKYIIFLRRNNDKKGPNSFVPHKINYQAASTEIANDDDLKPIFKALGRHAHAAIDVWANKTHEVCKPYSGATSILLSFTTLFVMSLFAIISCYTL